MKFTLFILLMLLSIHTSAESSLNFDFFAKIPILHNGRVKPLDTYARVNLLEVYEKSKLKNLSAIEWLAELIFDPNIAYNRRIFKIRNSDTVKALNLKSNKYSEYTFIEVSTAINNESKLISEISKVGKKYRTPTQQQMYELHRKVSTIFDISRSISLLIPKFKIPTREFSNKLNLSFDKKLSYLQVIQRKEHYDEIAKKVLDKKSGFSDEEYTLLRIGRDLDVIAADSYTAIFRIIPPQIGQKVDSEWLSPWQTIEKGQGNPLTAEYFNKWATMSMAYMEKDQINFKLASLATYKAAKKISYQVVTANKLEWEYIYNKWDLFTKSAALYTLSFLLLSLSWLVWKKKLEQSAFLLLAMGGVFHVFNLTLRCLIMDRPPVTTLYESVIFVSFICVLGAILIEAKRRDALGTFIGAILGSTLLFISFGYERDGDSMGMLAAVLDTNFWLATHVVTITIGYGCAFVSSILAHVYLIQKYIMSKKSDISFDIRETLRNMHGSILFALFFTVLGTILGGIWADQSWGRFWGWDPKENGAMLICMWLLWIVHGNLTKYFRDIEYALLTAFTSIIVVLAWFGVNLLNVGLHSYGFTESIANNIIFFTASEIVICMSLYILLIVDKKKKQKG